MTLQDTRFSPRAVVDFWIEAGPQKWFKKDAAFDAQFKARFLAAHEAAARGALDGWAADAQGALALLLLLDQERSVVLCEHAGPENLRFAKHHRDIVARFGRFPHRNALLGRESTPQEQQFLSEGGFSG